MKKGLFSRWSGSVRKRAMALDHAVSAAFSSRCGLNTQPRPTELIVSLTTIPERIGNVHLGIDCLLRQSLRPDRVILWLNECADPGRPAVNKNTLPRSLTKLTKRGLTIEWCKNIGPYCKLIPALKAFPQALIATADDDVYYPRHWLAGLYQAHLRQPQYIHCHRAHLMTFDDAGRPLPYNRWDIDAPGFGGPSPDLFPTGVGGVLYAPARLHPDVLNEELFLELCPKSDDIWFKAMAVLNGVQCRKVARDSPPLYNVRVRNNRRLMEGNVDGGGNDRQLRRVAEHYPAFAGFLTRR
jgi:hypothetical protein